MNALPPYAPQSLRVLLFEDNPLDAALIRKFLLTVGVRSTNIHHVDTIPSALQMLTRENVDVCLADYYLRPSTGFDLMDEAKRYDINVPFIMLTAMDDRSIDDGALARGAYGFLVKGELTVEGLERSIRYALMRHKRESTLARDALIDTLTGLPNRKAFYERVIGAVADNAGRNGMVAVALFNLNGTKFLNESFGTKVGDDMLCAVAKKLRDSKRASDMVARIGGDEFAVLMADLVLPGHAVAQAKSLVSAITGTVDTRDGKHDVNLAGGVATMTASQSAPAEAVDRLMQQATQAMFNAKLMTRRGGVSEIAVARLQ
ncbi:MAG: diguanylate cyclase [Rhodospirillaceae bacterium]|nr:MAG: diguanylate cyclase [Rhodospirillaceae bacterium]